MRRPGMLILLVGLALFAGACSGPFCNNGKLLTSEDITGKATSTPTSTPTATVIAASSPMAASTPAPFSGAIGLGYDHPPYLLQYNVTGGNSIGLVCGKLTNAPAGSVVAVTFTGATGQPPGVNATVGADGAFTMPFPITQFGSLTATVAGVKTSTGAALTGSVPPVSLQVAGGNDKPCTP